MNRFLKSFQYAWQGLKLAIREQQNLRIHLFAMLLVIGLSVVLHASYIEWCILFICIGVVISAELFNSAIEKWVDLVSPEQNKKAGDIKDISAAAVLILSIIAAIIGCIIFGNHLLFTI
jgi:diacylglycerol kinase (ATP)